ncbi:hypothetical protein ACFQ7N_38325 [Streptomyces niveus]|uniref:hypothetical protein n=1 Tax=Streptomyces niveus TaxID=193462 RepID=UPI003681951F
MTADEAGHAGAAAFETLRQTGVLCGSLIGLDAVEFSDWMAGVARVRARREAIDVRLAVEEADFWESFNKCCAARRQAAAELESARYEAATHLIACQVMTHGVRDCAEATGRIGTAIERHLAELAKGAK